MAGEDPTYVAEVKQLRCRAAVLGGDCSGGWPDAHHAGPRGLSQRAHDRTCIPLCRRHHREWHDAAGVFRTWRKAERAAWAEEQIAEVQRLVEASW